MRVFRTALDSDPIVSIVGPTGSGKTARALELYRPGDCLVSLDSVAVYRGLDIGSAKPNRSSHLWLGLDIWDPQHDRGTVADFCRHVLPDIEDALANQRRVIMVGGSHFYESALVDGLGIGRASDPVFQKSLEPLSDRDLWVRLNQRDPDWALHLNINDRYRLTRALDLSEHQGLSFQDSQTRRFGLANSRDVVTEVIGLESHREDDVVRLKTRLDEMVRAGWVDELRNLLASGLRPDSHALMSVGYRQMTSFVLGHTSWPVTYDEILTSHLQLVKKQKTWLRSKLKVTSQLARQ
jgi:tRNA dimethylallyltransferase